MIHAIAVYITIMASRSRDQSGSILVAAKLLVQPTVIIVFAWLTFTLFIDLCRDGKMMELIA